MWQLDESARLGCVDEYSAGAVIANERLIPSVQPQVSGQAALVARTVSTVLAHVHHRGCGEKGMMVTRPRGDVAAR
jgi:hypothetical protein